MKLFQILLLFSFSYFAMAIDLVDDSVYQVESSWKNQNDKSIAISQLHGKVQVVAFIYTYCEHTCPTIISRLKQITKKVPAELRENVNISLISLDPLRDTPAILKNYMQKHNLNDQQWTMLNGNPDDVLELAALMGVRYKPMGESDISHTNMITVLDSEGVIRYQMKGLNGNVDEVINAIENSVNSVQS